MNDLQIVEMYWKRNEQAISVTAEKYGTYCYSVAYGILHNEGNSELISAGQLGTIKSMASGGITRRAPCWSRRGACRTQGCGHVVASPGHPHVKAT